MWTEESGEKKVIEFTHAALKTMCRLWHSIKCASESWNRLRVISTSHARAMEARRRSREHFYGQSNGLIWRAKIRAQPNRLFLAFELLKKGATVTWDLRESSPHDRLVLKQILLGHQAKEGEFNVVQVFVVLIWREIDVHGLLNNFRRR